MKCATLTLTLFGFILLSLAQKSNDNLENQVLFIVKDDTITAGEYMAVYNKNREIRENIDSQTPREYLDLYINFKLKVCQAKEMGKDTTHAFKREYMSYKNQLAQSYLIDKNAIEELIREAYKRMKYDVKALHIMLTPEEDDTLTAYNQAKELIKRIKNGEDFSILSKEYSKDQYSAQKGGDLGYFTVFNMIYPFESAVYNTPVGEIADNPVRTHFGYHVIKVTDKRPARGEITVAHIMLVSDEESKTDKKENAKKKIYEIHEELNNGANFEELALKYSEDETSNKLGGQLPPFGINKMYPDFEDTAFSLENPSDFSKPVKTPIGWHIVKLIEKKSIPLFDKIKSELKVSVEKDRRSKRSYISIIKKLKKEYAYKEYSKIKKITYDQVDVNELKLNKYKAERVEGLNEVLFEFANKRFKVKDFLMFLEENQKKLIRERGLKRQPDVAFRRFVENQLIKYEKTRLEDKYPQFKLLSREYYEGILLFDLTEEKIWKTAIEDSIGLYQYYSSIKENYKWDTRFDVIIIDAANKKLAKKAMRALKNGLDPDIIKSQLNVSFTQKVYEKGSHDLLSNFNMEKEGFTKIKNIDDRYILVKVNKVVPPTIKTLQEARGLIVSSYQDYLEKEWVNSLREQYEVKVNQNVLEKTIAALE